VRFGLHWLNTLDKDYENLRSAFGWALEYHPEEALNLIGDLFLYFDIRSDLHAMKRAARDALDKVEALPSEDALTEKRRLRLRSKGYLALAQFTMSLGETSEAMAMLDTALALAREVDDSDLISWSLGFISVDAVFLNAIEKMYASATELFSRAQGQNEEWFRAVALAMMSWAEGAMGNNDRRDALAKQALSMIDRLENPMTLNALMMMGLEARIRGNLITARNYLEKCLSYTKLLRSRPYEAMIYSELAHVDRQMGNLEKAKQAYRITILKWNDLGHVAAIAHQLECFAYIAQAEGQLLRAVKLFGAAESLREKTNSPMTTYEQIEYQKAVELLRGDVEIEKFKETWSQGRLLQMEAAISLALEENQLDPLTVANADH
jgi:hypothetical protein